MPWGVVAAVGGALVGGVIQSEASEDASHAQRESSREATDLQREIYNSTVARNDPFVRGGTQAFNALLSRLGLAGDPSAPGYNTFGQPARFDPGSPFQAPTAAQVMAEPGYEFGLRQGQNALDRRAAARGTSYSGAALAEAARYAGDYATGRYGDAFTRGLQGHQQGFNDRLNTFNANQQANQQAFNQLLAPIGYGQASANGTAAAGQQFGAQAGANIIGAGNAAAANSLAQGNIWGNALNQGISGLKGMGQSSYTDRSSFRWDDPYRNRGYFGGDEGE